MIHFEDPEKGPVRFNEEKSESFHAERSDGSATLYITEKGACILKRVRRPVRYGSPEMRKDSIVSVSLSSKMEWTDYLIVSPRQAIAWCHENGYEIPDRLKRTAEEMEI